MKIFVLGLALSIAAGTAFAGASDLVGKQYPNMPLPTGGSTGEDLAFDDYYECGGAVVGGPVPNITVVKLRKGKKGGCEGGKFVVVLQRSDKAIKNYEILDAVDALVKKGQWLQLLQCEGADVAVSKIKDAEYLTDHVLAWKIVGNKFEPVANLKSVRCKNADYGL